MNLKIRNLLLNNYNSCYCYSCKENAEEELLDKQRCLDSLADLRHAKWFQVRLSNQIF
jgi:hypothetical protein